MRELYRSEHFLVTLDEDRRLVRRTRTDRPFATIVEIERAYGALLQALAMVDRPGHVMLVDLRLAPPRNDPAFEQIVEQYRPRLYGGFRRVAVLAKTEAGRLQLGRMLRSSSLNWPILMDEAAALSYLAGSTQPVQGSARPIKI
jgi:hypothetical protein